MISLKKRLCLIFLFLFFLITGIFANNYVVENPKAKVCILYYKSRYKLELIKIIIKKLNEKGISVYTDVFKNADKYKPTDYDAILILSGVAVLTAYPGATEYIKKHDYAQNIIYFCAVVSSKEIAYGSLDTERIDAITAASKMKNIEATVNIILEKIFEVIT